MYISDQTKNIIRFKMLTYNDIAQQTDIEYLKDHLRVYRKLESSVYQEDRWRLNIGIPAPGILAKILPPEYLSGSEAIEQRIKVLTDGNEGTEYWQSVLQKAEKMYDFYKQIEAKMPEKDLWKLKVRVNERPVLPTEILKSEIANLKARVGATPKL